MVEAAKSTSRHEVLITSAHDLHARPARALVAAAGCYDCDISITKDTRVANAKSTLAVLSLAVQRGDTVTLSAAGHDGGNAIAELAVLINGADTR